MKEIQFIHRRTKKEGERFQKLWPNKPFAFTEEFKGSAIYCGDVGGGVTVVKLYDGEQIVVLLNNGDQSGASTEMLIDMEVDNAEIKVTSIGADVVDMNRLARRRLPVDALKALEQLS